MWNPSNEIYKSEMERSYSFVSQHVLVLSMKVPVLKTFHIGI